VMPKAIVKAQWVGRTVPLHATSTGKSILAWLEEAECEALLDHKLTAYTDTTIVDRRRLRAELEQARSRGFAVCRGELESSLYGVSSPVLDPHERPYAVISIWGPRERVDETRFAALGEMARRAAADVALARRRLGSASD
jgi:DNA-binding IclR family transcriptional regulator